MERDVVVLGYGPVGRSLTERLTSIGARVTVVQRHSPDGLPRGATYRKGDVFDAASLRAATRGADSIISTIGLPYRTSIWETQWPKAMEAMLEAAEAASARFIFADNIYMYGPFDGPLTEDLPMRPVGPKGRIRAVITEMWQEAHAKGRVLATAVRAPDFYGPHALSSWLGEPTVGRLAEGKAAQWLGSPDVPHDYAYVADFARGLESLLAAPDSAFGQAWHVPNAPTHTTRELIAMTADILGVAPRVTGLPSFLVPIAAFFMQDIAELTETQYQFRRPLIVDSSKFARHFWSDPTPFEAGLRITAAWFRHRVRA